MNFNFKHILGIAICTSLLTGCGNNISVSTTAEETVSSQNKNDKTQDTSQNQNICTPQEIRKTLVKYAEKNITTVQNNISDLTNTEYKDKEIICMGVNELNSTLSMPPQYIDDINSFQKISEKECPEYIPSLYFLITYRNDDNEVRTAFYKNLDTLPEKVWDIKGSCFDCKDHTGYKSSTVYKTDNKVSMLINYSDDSSSYVAKITFNKDKSISADWCAVVPRVIFDTNKSTSSKIGREWTVYTNCIFKDGEIDYSNGTIYAENISISPNTDNYDWDARKNWIKLDYEISHNGETPTDEIVETLMSSDVCKKHLYFSTDWKKENGVWKDLFDAEVINKLDSIISAT